MPIAPVERVVEPAQAREAAGEGDLGDRQRRFGQQLLGQQQPARQQQLDRRHAQLLLDDAANLPRAELELVRDLLESRLLVERVLPRGAARSAARCAGASSTGALPGASSGRQRRQGRKPACSASCGVSKKRQLACLRRLRRADRPAVDAGRRDADEEHAVEPRVAGRQRVVEPAAVLVHAHHHTASGPDRLAIFGHDTGFVSMSENGEQSRGAYPILSSESTCEQETLQWSRPIHGTPEALCLQDDGLARRQAHAGGDRRGLAGDPVGERSAAPRAAERRDARTTDIRCSSRPSASSRSILRDGGRSSR